MRISLATDPAHTIAEFIVRSIRHLCAVCPASHSVTQFVYAAYSRSPQPGLSCTITTRLQPPIFNGVQAFYIPLLACGNRKGSPGSYTHSSEVPLQSYLSDRWTCWKSNPGPGLAVKAMCIFLKFKPFSVPIHIRMVTRRNLIHAHVHLLRYFLLISIPQKTYLVKKNFNEFLSVTLARVDIALASKEPHLRPSYRRSIIPRP